MPYSKRLRRLVAASRSVLDDDNDPGERLQDITSEPDELELEHGRPQRRLPTSVPLDRRRSVPLADMTEEELNRARDQAVKRIGRTRPSADLDRYELQREAIEDALNRFSRSSGRPPVEHRKRHTPGNSALVAQMVREMDDGDTPPPSRVPTDKTVASGSSDDSGGPPRFESHPADTYPD